MKTGQTHRLPTVAYSAVLMGLALMLAFAGCGEDSVLMNSRWKSGDIAIDGRDGDWGERLAMFEKQKISVGIANDDANLYICLKFLERPSQQQVMRHGFTLWIDSTGSNSKKWGIHYPVGMRGMNQMQGRGMGEPADGGLMGDSDRFRSMRENFTQMLHEVAIVNASGEELDRFNNLGGSGFDVSMSDSTGALIYELRIPLAPGAGQKYSLGVAAGGIVSLGMETQQVSRPNGGGQSGDRPDGGGGRGRGGMGGGRGGGRRGGGGGGGQAPEGGRSFTPAEPINVWAKVTLATAGK